MRARSKYTSAQSDLAGDAIGLGLEPSFFGCFDRSHRFTNAPPSIIELAKPGMGSRQI